LLTSRQIFRYAVPARTVTKTLLSRQSIALVLTIKRQRRQNKTQKKLTNKINKR